MNFDLMFPRGNSQSKPPTSHEKAIENITSSGYTNKYSLVIMKSINYSISKWAYFLFRTRADGSWWKISKRKNKFTVSKKHLFNLISAESTSTSSIYLASVKRSLFATCFIVTWFKKIAALILTFGLTTIIFDNYNNEPWTIYTKVSKKWGHCFETPFRKSGFTFPQDFNVCGQEWNSDDMLLFISLCKTSWWDGL